METLLYHKTISEEKLSNDLDQEEISKLALKHKLVAPILKANPDLRINSLDWGGYEQEQDEKEKELCRLITELNEKEVPYLLIKGPVMRRYYPKSLPRTNGDYDFIIRSISDYWIMADILSRLGFNYCVYPCFTDYHGKLMGHAKYSKTTETGVYVEVEVNIGGFITSELTWIDYDFLQKSNQVMEIKGTKVKIPSDTVNLIILIAESLGNRYLRIRDIIDFKFMKFIAELKEEEIEKQLKDLSLYRYFLYLKKKLHAFESHSTIKTREGIIHNIMNSVRRDFFHSFPLARRSSKSVKRIVYYYLMRIGETMAGKERFLQLVKKTEDWFDMKKMFNYGIIFNFIPLEVEVTGDWKWINIDGFDIIRTPLGVFLASSYCIVYENELETAGKAARTYFSSP